ncbi:MAG: tetratricopeptide repeat protein [Bacteroidetes bacterium]|nr:tetratricopeptide repeat protein [Bacteroidota bacterium]
MLQLPKPLALLALFSLSFLLQAQEEELDIDALKKTLQEAKHDTTRCRILYDLSQNASDEEWPGFNQQLLQLSENNLKNLPPKAPAYRAFQKYYAEALNNVGYLANQEGNGAKALEYYTKSLKVSEAMGDMEGLATSLNNVGAIYNHLGDIGRALEYYSRSLKIREKIGDQQGIANSLNNIGIIYANQGDLKKALESYNKALNIREKIGDKDGMTSNLNNIGIIYDQLGNPSKALEYYEKSLKLKEELGDKRGIATSLNNIGRISNNLGNTAKALDYLQKGLKIREEIGDKQGIAFSLHNIGNVYLRQKKYDQALDYMKRSMTLSKEIGFPESIRNAAQQLSAIHKAKGNYKDAFENYELYILMRDSIENSENQKATIRRELQYNYDKKAAADSIVNAKQAEVQKAQVQKQAAELRAQRNQQYALYGGLVLVLIFAGFMYNRFKVTSRQKNIIEQQEKETQYQKHIIEEKHKEITDSINYAERIQRSFLASEQLLTENLQNYFVCFKPKDVVSGDFYWASGLKDGRFAYATADSTGHGVPGAIMSILNISSLEKAIETETEPAAILNVTRTLIIERLKKDGSPEGGKDGMDCSLVVLDLPKCQLSYAAANNPVWIIRQQELIECKPDKMPVGKHDKEAEPFTQHSIELQPGDVVYTFTDGLPDQFGGPKGKKFMYKQFKELLLSISHFPMPEQREKILESFNTWKANTEQVDDMCVIGVRI